MDPLLPYALAFAAGAMIFVVVEELVPEAHRGGNGDIATMGVMVGFSVMMVLDVGMGEIKSQCPTPCFSKYFW